MGIIYCPRNVCTLSMCYTEKNSLKIVHQFQSMNKRNKVELNKVKKRHAILYDFYILYDLYMTIQERNQLNYSFIIKSLKA